MDFNLSSSASESIQSDKKAHGQNAPKRIKRQTVTNGNLFYLTIWHVSVWSKIFDHNQNISNVFKTLFTQGRFENLTLNQNPILVLAKNIYAWCMQPTKNKLEKDFDL